MTTAGAPAARPSSMWLVIAAVVALGLSLTPWGQQVLYPFKLFTTWVHECGHAFMTLLVGGDVSSITIQPDTSGLTQSLVPNGRIARALIASSGYLGAAVFGCLLLASTRIEKWSHAIIWALGAIMIATLAFWIRNVFGFAVVLGWAVALLLLARVRNNTASQFVLSLLAVQVALNAIYDIRVLFLVKGVPTDAATMASLFVLPAWLWASLWMLISIAMLGLTLWATRMNPGGVRRT
jgi:hypothetical protein